MASDQAVIEVLPDRALKSLCVERTLVTEPAVRLSTSRVVAHSVSMHSFAVAVKAVTVTHVLCTHAMIAVNSVKLRTSAAYI